MCESLDDNSVLVQHKGNPFSSFFHDMSRRCYDARSFLRLFPDKEVTLLMFVLEKNVMRQEKVLLGRAPSMSSGHEHISDKGYCRSTIVGTRDDAGTREED